MSMDNAPSEAEIGSDVKATADQVKSDAANLAATAKAEAANLASVAKENFSKIAGEATGQAKSLAAEAQNQVSAMVGQAKDVASQQKDMVADQLGGVASAINEVADKLEQSNTGGAGYVRMIADSANRLTDTIQNKDIDQLLGMAQDFGRRQPAVFIGAAALLGFATSRFLLATTHRNENNVDFSSDFDDGQSYGRSADYAGGYGNTGGSRFDTESDEADELDDAGQTPRSTYDTNGGGL